MGYLPLTLKGLLDSGCNLTIEDKSYSPQTLTELAKSAKKNDVQLTIKATDLLPQTLLGLAKIAGKNLTIII